MNTDDFNMELVYFYSLFLRVGLMDFSEYTSWLNNVFLKDHENENELLIELEYATNNKDKTIQILDEYLYDKYADINYELLGKMLVDEIEKIYMANKCDVEELAHQLYGMWNYLPYDIGSRKPFHILSYIDEPLSYGGRAQTIYLLEQFIDFYE